MNGLSRLWRLVRWAVRAEIAVWRGLFRWLARRPDVPEGTVGVGYAQMVTPLMLLWTFVCAVEVPVVDLLLPWDALRLPLLVVGVWGVLWMLGLVGAYRTRPHLLSEDTWVLRGGLHLEVSVPLAAIAAVTTQEQAMPGSIRSWAVVEDLLQVGISGRTNLQLTLVGPTPLGTPAGTRTVSRVGVWVDEPRAVRALLRDRVEGDPGGRPSDRLEPVRRRRPGPPR